VYIKIGGTLLYKSLLVCSRLNAICRFVEYAKSKTAVVDRWTNQKVEEARRLFEGRLRSKRKGVNKDKTMDEMR
jgi:hypothetical protein